MVLPPVQLKPRETFFGLFRNCLDCDSLRWSHIHFIRNMLMLAVLDIDYRKNTLFLSVNVFSTKVLIGDTICTSPTGDHHLYVVILASQFAKVQPLAVQRQYLHFLVTCILSEYWFGPGNRTRDLLLCSQIPYRLN